MVSAGKGSGTEYVRAGSERGAEPIQIPIGRLCGDARACPSFDERAGKRHAIESGASAQAKRVSENAAEKGAEKHCGVLASFDSAFFLIEDHPRFAL